MADKLPSQNMLNKLFMFLSIKTLDILFTVAFLVALFCLH